MKFKYLFNSKKYFMYKNQNVCSIIKENNYSIVYNNNLNPKYSLFFFAGFMDNGPEYIDIFINQFLSHPLLSNVRIIIPSVPKYHNNPESKHFLYKKNILDTTSWFNTKNNTPTHENLIFFKEKDEIIINLVKDEINLVGEKNIIFVGFSMGSRYYIHILEQMNIKIFHCFAFKSFLFYYEQNNEDYLKTTKGNNCSVFYSTNDKIVVYDAVVYQMELWKRYFGDVELKLNEGRKHLFQSDEMSYLVERLVTLMNCNNKSKF